MSVTPLAPDLPTRETFGPDLQNFGPVIDPTTEFDAEAVNRMRAQLAMISQVAPKAMAVIRVAAGIATLVKHSAVWGNSDAVKPGFSRTSAGVILVAWAASYFDLQATPEEHAVSITGFTVSVGSDSGAKRIVQYNQLSPTSVQVLTSSTAGTAADADEITVIAW